MPGDLERLKEEFHQQVIRITEIFVVVYKRRPTEEELTERLHILNQGVKNE
jgi:hypothetical protein